MAGWEPEQPYDTTAHHHRIWRGQLPSNPDLQQSYGQPWQLYDQPPPYPPQDPDGPPTQPYPRQHPYDQPQQPYSPQQSYGQPWPSYGQPPQQPGRTAAHRRGHRRSSGAGGGGGRRKVAALVAGGFVLLLIIIGIAAQGGIGTPTGNASPQAHSASPSATPAIKTAIAQHPTTAAATSAAAAPSRAFQTTPAAAPPPSASAGGCHPLSSSGTCYKAGEFCPTADQRQQGVAQDGEAITCEQNGSHWRWEPV